MIAAMIALQAALQIMTRAIAGPLPAQAGAVHGVVWLDADGGQNLWPRCVVAASTPAWSCWGPGIENPGVVILYDQQGIWWGLSDATRSVQLRPARWGRLVVITRRAPQPSPIRVTFNRPAAPPPGRARAMRLDTAPIPDARASIVAPNALWIAGVAIPAKAWVEIASDATVPLYLPLTEIAAAPASLPLHIALSDAHPLEGRVLGADDRPAAGALVTMFRLIDPPAPPNGFAALPKRVLVAESIADDEGQVQLPALGDADYELVAWHPQLGRASLPVGGRSAEVVVRLRRPGIVRGRVLAGARPLAGVVVLSVPDAGAFSEAVDMTELKGGDTSTDANGRFTVMVAASGGGELRIGGGTHPVKRVPLPRLPVRLLDLGDLDLGQTIAVTVVLDSDPGCGLRAAGPIGRTGLHLVPATRTGAGTFDLSLPEPGLWEFTLTCERGRHSLHPSVVRIEPAPAAKEVRMMVR